MCTIWLSSCGTGNKGGWKSNLLALKTLILYVIKQTKVH